MILDEPTNHLDIEAVAEIISSLNTYTGTVVVVSHDRTFLTTMKLTRIMHLAPQGLSEIDELEEFYSVTEDSVSKVVKSSFS